MCSAPKICFGALHARCVHAPPTHPTQQPDAARTCRPLLRRRQTHTRRPRVAQTGQQQRPAAGASAPACGAAWWRAVKKPGPLLPSPAAFAACAVCSEIALSTQARQHNSPTTHSGGHARSEEGDAALACAWMERVAARRGCGLS
ncbi:hypothetical protein Rsub_01322 [Raphidocelis subcapitata]|uniref:Uncharacterized protein n=1 Tax=Raphidocelis subcapitata TaxID=307507 RepID=A0A2V0NUJ9_9CHLO|nr:hypothetical protein Rsub_01322 [Raphidocelis subcapitata]|eukprot:GBF88607.1 hypothetical protein Rsub_01322 [Raphidocelis subcapitata]